MRERVDAEVVGVTADDTPRPAEAGGCCWDEWCGLPPRVRVERGWLCDYHAALAATPGTARLVCPRHGIPDCSPLLNGCTLTLTARSAEVPFTVLDLDDPFFDGQALPDALRDYAHVHSATGVCVKNVHGPFCEAASDDTAEDNPGPEVDRDLCAEHRDGKPGEPHQWRRGRRGRTRVVTCRPAEAASDGPTYAVDSGWLVEVVNEHTCGTGPDGYYGAHEPGCGMVPVAKVDDLLRALAAQPHDSAADTPGTALTWPPRLNQTVTATGVVRTVETLFPDGHYRVTLDVPPEGGDDR